MIEAMLFRKPASGPNIIQGIYSSLAPGSTARSGQCLVMVGDLIYSYGGTYGALNNTMEVYDIGTNTWATVTPNNTAPTPRHSPGFCLLNNKLYMFGGSTGVNWGPMSNEAWCYDFATKLWTKLANYPVSLALVSAVAINGKIYLLGGYTGTAASSPFHEYDPVANSYRAITHSLSARYGHKAVVVDGLMYVFGGSIGPSAVRESWSYNPVSNVWASLKVMPEGKPHSYVVAIGPLIYIYGGKQGNESAAINKLYRYNTGTGNWTEMPPGPSLYYMGAAVANENAIYMHGGIDINVASTAQLLKIT